MHTGHVDAPHLLVRRCRGGDRSHVHDRVGARSHVQDLIQHCAVTLHEGGARARLLHHVSVDHLVAMRQQLGDDE